MTIKNLIVRLRAVQEAVNRSFHRQRNNGSTLFQIFLKGAKQARLGPKSFVRQVIATDRITRINAEHALANSADLDRSELSAYELWLSDHEPSVDVLDDGVLISIVMPTCDTPEIFLREVLDSVRAQTYQNWELCICDDASNFMYVKRMLDEASFGDPRIKTLYRQARGGIASATNDALKIASGTYVAFLDHDDLLHAEAIASVAAAFARTNADIVYTDHDCVTEQGLRRLPYFKPDWSLDLFLSQMYLGHLVVFNRDLVSRVGGLRSEMDGSQDYDLVLRCLTENAKIAHVPRVLYHWRQHSGSTSANADAKPYAHHAGRNSLQSFLNAKWPGAEARDGAYMFCYDVHYNLDKKNPLVSVIIPTRDRVDLLAVCVRTLREITAYQNFEIIVVDNGSVQPETLHWLASMANGINFRVVSADIPFNWSALNNLGAREAKGEVLLFLNNDTEIFEADWLERLVDNALRPDVGVCGPLLLYSDRTIQHAGVVVGMGGWADHVFKGLPATHMQNYFTSPVMRRNVLAVTGACFAIEQSKFDAIGGFDESFLICGSDVEICLRSFHSGLVNVYVPESRLIHHESKSRDPHDIAESDFIRSEEAYHPYRTSGDPYFNHNLDPMSCIPRLRSH